VQSIIDAFHAWLGITNGWVPYLVAISGLGALSMGLIEAAKDITPICRWYQRLEMLLWIRKQAAVAEKRLGVMTDRRCAEAQLLLLATDSDQRSFYNLEIEKLCGQWNSAIQIVLDSPTLYPDLLQCVAANARRSDFMKVRDQECPEPLPPDIEAALPQTDRKERFDRRRDFVDAQLHVTHQIQRAIDAFQINTTFRWKWIMQLSSYFVSIGLAEYAIIFHNTKVNVTTNAIFAGLLAGFLAPVANDVLSAIQNLRKL
jgi:hypothetical protein